MAHVQRPDLVFQQNGRVHLNCRGGGSAQSTTSSRGLRISGSNGSTARSKRDGTGVETRFGLSAKRTSPFKSAKRGGGSVQSTTGSRGVRISG